jgi:hypothetical protein
VLTGRDAGTMWCAYLCISLALVSLRAALKTPEAVIVVEAP